MTSYDENGERRPELLTLSAAQKRVHKSRQTLWRWRASGLKTFTGDDGEMYVLADDHLAMMRQKIKASRVNRFQLREKVNAQRSN